MTNNPLPTDTEMATLGDLNAIVRWCALDVQVWREINAGFGNFPNIRLLAHAPPEGIATALEHMELRRLGPDGAPLDPPTRPLTMVEMVQTALAWRICRKCFGLSDIDLLAPGVVASLSAPSVPAAAMASAPVAVGGGTKQLGVQKVKVSQIADQLDDTELELVGKAEVDEAYAQYRLVMGADPVKETEPTAEQLTVMINKVVTRGAAPYADFSVLTPYARRTQRQLKAKGFLLQEDGSWKQTEVAGPPTFSAWTACWDVYRTILLMLRHNPTVPGGDKKPVITWAALDEYFRNIATLNRQYPECWHLILQAEDRCRSDHLERIRRSLTRAAIEARLPMDLNFDVQQPWIGVFTHAARDQAYWNQEVQIPAQAFIARQGGRSMSRQEAEGVDMTGAEKDASKVSKGISRPHGEGESKSAKRRRREKDRREEDWRKSRVQMTSQYDSYSWRGSGSSKAEGKGKMQRPRRYGQFFVTDRDGNQICYKFSKGQPGACQEPCGDQRAHVCQLCLGQHPNVQCTKSKAGDKSGGGKGK